MLNFTVKVNSNNFPGRIYWQMLSNNQRKRCIWFGAQPEDTFTFFIYKTFFFLKDIDSEKNAFQKLWVFNNSPKGRRNPTNLTLIFSQYLDLIIKLLLLFFFIKNDRSIEAVVDSRLEIHEINVFRVIDASIMSNIPGFNTNPLKMTIAEKGIDKWLSFYWIAFCF